MDEVVELLTGVDEVVELPRSVDLVEPPRSVDLVELLRSVDVVEPPRGVDKVIEVLAGVDEVVELLAGVDEVVVGADWPVPELTEHAGTAKSAVTAAAVSPPRRFLIRSGSLPSGPSSCVGRWTIVRSSKVRQALPCKVSMESPRWIPRKSAGDERLHRRPAGDGPAVSVIR